MNYKLLIQYDGTDFHGWQSQDGLRTVQGELTRALSLIEGRDVNVHGSGRTDAGVHAEGQVASVEIQRDITPEKLRAAINGNVGKDVRVLEAAVAAPEFHARYSAIEKTYVYRIVNAPVMSPFWSRYAQHEARRLDLEAIQRAAESFLGKHDWTAFSAAQSDVEDRVRTITHLEITERVDERSRSTLVEIRVSADGFLRYMVRAIAGTLMAIGRGELNSDAVQKAIEAGVRPTVAATAPACGLTLLSVRYSENTD
ncbi:MAG: tRNA pseudouridine(38-40) synthase TruA [Pyrinomonadaceae bacterium]